jgi:DNA gyrase subunit A
VDAEISFNPEDLIADEQMVITISHQGYIKRLPPDTYRQQRRGGRGIAGMGTKEEDWVEHLFLADTHDYLCVFTARGQLYWLKVHQIPLASRTSRGKPVVNLLDISKDEKIASILRVREFEPDRYVLFATRSGQVKKTSLAAYRHVSSRGINAINIVEGDSLIDARLTDGNNDLILATKKGMAIRFNESDVREMGRAARGVRGVRLKSGDEVVGAVVVREGASLLTVTGRGAGKRSRVEEYRVQKRGGQGLINFRLTGKTGEVVGVREVTDEDELMLVTRGGVVNRQPASQIRVIGRATQGVRLITLDEGDELVDLAKVAVDLDDEAEEEGVDGSAEEGAEGGVGDEVEATGGSE